MKKEIQKEIDSLAPKLSKLDKRNPYKVPENYFDGLADKVIARANQEEHNSDTELKPQSGHPGIISLFKNPYNLAIAASVILLIGFFQFSGFDQKDQLIDMSDQEIFAYMDANLDDFDSDIFIEYDLLNEEDILAMNTDFSVVDDLYYDEILEDIDNETLQEIFN